MEDLASADVLLRAHPSQEANADALLKRETSGPISMMIVFAVRVLSPGTSVRFTPAIRYSSDFRSNAGSLAARWYMRFFVPEGRFGWAFGEANIAAEISRFPCLRLPSAPPVKPVCSERLTQGEEMLWEAISL